MCDQRFGGGDGGEFGSCLVKLCSSGYFDGVNLGVSKDHWLCGQIRGVEKAIFDGC